MVNSSIIDHAPIEVQKPKYCTASVQTDKPRLSMCMVNAATTAHAPIDILSPKHKQTRDWVSQTDISNPKLKITKFMVTPDEWPLDEIIPRRPTSDATVQTEAQVETPVEEIAPALEGIAGPRQNKVGLAHWVLQLLFTVFMLFGGWFIHILFRLNAWETANGYGYANSSGQGGAFGNGRYLLGFIPMAMDIGNTDLYEQFCRFTSIFIAQWEGPHIRSY